MKKYIIVQLEVEGIHFWREAPDEVYYLRNSHRHNFFIRLCIEVKHNNRDKEFIMVKHSVKDYLENRYLTPKKSLYFDSKSCEDLAEELLKEFGAKWVEVYEDKENGARIEND